MDYLLTLPSVRERSTKVFDQAKAGKLTNFTADFDKLPAVAEYVHKLIERDYQSDASKIPPHGRWQHFDVGHKRLEPLIESWQKKGVSKDEIAARLVDLFVVSVLLDAGAGPTWTYKEGSGQKTGRSEGIAIASLDMFAAGLFGDSDTVTGPGLERLTLEQLSDGFQVSDKNPMDGLEGRYNLLVRLGKALIASPELFGPSARPGHLITYLKSTEGPIKIATLWEALMKGLGPIWPEGRLKINGQALGDAWVCSSLPNPSGDEAGSVTPFHKLTQWLTYSILVPMKEYGGLTFVGEEQLTGLPEYRNGGLLVDFGVLTLKPEALKQSLSGPNDLPKFEPSSDVIVEWRALTVGFLDAILPLVNAKLEKPLVLPQLLEAGTWKAGREIAKEKRANGGPPIEIQSDGTVF
ncbi:Uracil catabolism protein 4 [Yarrowia sp. B02]|nr:Uracil catabolism protein 4 [Yarrowia sp. B02]